MPIANVSQPLQCYSDSGIQSATGASIVRNRKRWLAGKLEGDTEGLAKAKPNNVTLSCNLDGESEK